MVSWAENLLCSGEEARSALRVTGSEFQLESTGVLGGIASRVTDLRFEAGWSSSSSSAISTRRFLRELVEEAVEPEAVCKEQAAESFVSVRALAESISKTVSYGENRSQTKLKWTATRAGGWLGGCTGDVVEGVRKCRLYIPCIKRDESSGRYLSTTLRRLYLM